MLSEATLGGLCPACTAGVVLAVTSETRSGSLLTESGLAATGSAWTDFGDFELIEEIARGGMGVVYRARQKRLNRILALKLILAGRFAGEEQVKRFHAEAEAAASLRHPNIVAIHDVGVVAGQYYLSMDLIEGANLTALVREHPLTHRKAAMLVREVAGAVEYAHERGVIHRDLKPSNILIDRDGRPHVTDFGLAKRVDGDSDLTQSGQVLGSPSFAAPEQTAGRRHEVGRRSDVYSLGAILYYLLVSRPPFLAESLEQTLAMVLVSDPLAPRKLDPSVPRDLETICLKCLEKDPARRYPTAALLADELERCLRGEPIRARPIRMPEKVLRWTRRNRVAALFGTLAMLVLLLGVSGVFWQWRRAERNAANEYLERTRAEATAAQLQWQQAEESLARDESFRALTHMARILRSSPTNRAVAERILSVLSQRPFPLPITPVMRHEGGVLATAFSRDGGRVATASADGTAVVWDGASGRRLTGPLTHDGPVNVIQFSPDDALLVTGSEAGGIRVWETETGQERLRFQGGTNAVTLAEVDPRGRWVLAATRDGRVTVYRAATGEAMFPPIPHASRVSAARFNPTGDQFLTASQADGLVRVFDVLTGDELHAFDFNGWILSARFSADGRRIAVASYHKWACVWTPDGAQPLVTVWQNDVVNDAALSPDGMLLATISRDRRALVWDSRTGDLIFSLPPHLTWVEEMAFSPDGLTLMTRDQGNRVVVWDLLSGRPRFEPIQTHKALRRALLSLNGERLLLSAMDGTSQIWRIDPRGMSPTRLRHAAEATVAEFSPDGQRLVVGRLDGVTTVYDLIRGLPDTSFRQQGPINFVQFSPDGSEVLTASNDKTSVVRDLETGSSLSVQHDQRVIRAEFSPDGAAFVTASFDGTARTWSTQSGEPLSQPMLHPGRLWFATFSPDGRRVATACDDTRRGTEHHARIWEAESGQPMTPPLRHSQGVYRVAFDPSGRFLATASADNTAALWSVRSGARALEFRHNGPVRHVAFSPDGHRLVTASQDNTARVWDVGTGQSLGEVMRHEREVLHAAWGSDGRRVATACADGSVRVWDSTTGRPMTEVMRHPRGVRWLAFSPDGRQLACPSTHTFIWNLPTVVGDPPNWLPDLAEAVAGAPVTAFMIPDAPVSDGLFEFGQKLVEMPDSDPMKSWAEWFFRGRFGSAPASEAPLSDISLDHETKPTTIEAIHAHPTAAAAWHRLFELAKVESIQENPHRDAQAEYFNRKAVALNPSELSGWLGRLEWLNASKRTELLAETYEAALDHHPANVELCWLRAGWLDHAHKIAEAADAYRKILDLETNRRAERYLRSANRRRNLLIQLGEPNRAQEEWLRAMDVPGRPHNLPAACIDLSAHFNAALHEPWHDRRRLGNDLSQIPPGRFVARQVTFDVRGVIQLAGTHLDRVEPGFPMVVNGIAVGSTAAKLHFLHAAGWGFSVPDETIVGGYRVHYVDGRTEHVPVRGSIDLQEWFHQGPEPLADLAGALAVDMGRNAANIPLRLFIKTWHNPRPAVSIATIDFLSERTGAAPFLVALTVEP